MMSISRSQKFWIVATVAVIGLIAGYAYHLNGDSFDFGDTEVKVVISSSMDGEPREEYPIKTVPVKSLVVIHDVPSGESERESFYSSLNIGDILTFYYNNPVSGERMVVTHRIIDIQTTTDASGNAHYTFTLKGDSIDDDPTNTSTQTVTSNSGDVIGKVVGVSLVLGEIVVFLSSWLGKFVVIVGLCAVIIVSQLHSLYHTLKSGKQKDEDATEDGSEDAGEGEDGPDE